MSLRHRLAPAGPGSDPPSDPAAWRARQLLRAGFEAGLAGRTAAACSFDLHELIELVERGCPPPLAVRILAPLDRGRPC
jgi:hypothetical protein